jgi:hypothetical protein
VTPIKYDRPDGVLTFDRLSSVLLSNTNHEEDQPVHLKVNDMSLHKASEHAVYGGPSQRYCPAGVYEWVEGEGGGPNYVRTMRWAMNVPHHVNQVFVAPRDPCDESIMISLGKA